MSLALFIFIFCRRYCDIVSKTAPKCFGICMVLREVFEGIARGFGPCVLKAKLHSSSACYYETLANVSKTLATFPPISPQPISHSEWETVGFFKKELAPFSKTSSTAPAADQCFLGKPFSLSHTKSIMAYTKSMHVNSLHGSYNSLPLHESI
jgi:hypothetical protein